VLSVFSGGGPLGGTRQMCGGLVLAYRHFSPCFCLFAPSLLVFFHWPGPEPGAKPDLGCLSLDFMVVSLLFRASPILFPRR